MQPLSVTPGFWFVKVNRAALESLSVIVTVPAEKVFPVFSVLPDSAAHVPGPATDHSAVSRARLSARRVSVAGLSNRLRDRPMGRAVPAVWATGASSWMCDVDVRSMRGDPFDARRGAAR